MRLLRLPLFAVLLLSVITLGRSADAWTPSALYTTRANLWGIAYDGTDRMVAVGEQGTILLRSYSSARTYAISFSARLSPTSAWLTGVAYGNQRWVAVGDLGTIITSDDGGDTWTVRTSGTSTRLNAVAYGNNRWLAVGEAGTVLTSADGITWSARPALGTGFFRGLAFGQGQFVFGGAQGSLYTTTDAVNFTPVALVTTANIESVAISENRFWIVGSNGLLATATQLGAWSFATAGSGTVRAVVAKNSEQASTVGDTAAAAFTYAAPTWTAAFNGPAFLATAAALGQNEVIAVGFSAGLASALLSPSVAVSITPVGAAIYGQDLLLKATLSGTTATGYQWTRDGIDVPGATQSEFLLPASELTNANLYRVRAITLTGNLTSAQNLSLTIISNGRPDVVDHSFKPVLTARDGTVVPQLDGKILIFGNFSVTPTGGLTSGLARLNPDGSLDLGFRAGVGVVGPSSIFDLKPMADGRIYARGNFTSIGGVPRSWLARLLPNGEVDQTFTLDLALGRDLSSFTVDSSGRAYLADSNKIYRLSLSGTIEISWEFKAATVLGVDGEGRILATQPYDSPTPLTAPSGIAVYRFLPDGTRDSTYARSVFKQIQPVGVADDQVYGASVTFQGVGGQAFEFLKLKADGTLDDGYKAKVPPSPYPATRWSYKFRSNGSLVISTDGDVRSYDLNGNLEPFYASAPDLGFYVIQAFEADGSILATVNAYATPAFIRIRPITGRAGRLTNLSVRSYVASASDPLIVGFVGSGTGNTSALVRAVGPSLAPFGVSDAMADPRLNLLRDGVPQTENDNWPAGLAQRFAAVGAFALTSNSADAALESPITAGNYTAVITSTTGGAGTALAEVYESADAAPRRLINVSSRARVDSSHPLIVGFSITGEVPVRVLIRGVGPTLTAFGVSGVLADPQLKLYRGSTILWENDNWITSDSTQSITSTAKAAGAFALSSSDSKDAAMVVTLAPGSYTAIVSGANETSGVALVEVYEAP